MFLLQIKECADNVELSGGRKGAGGGGTVEKKCAAKAVIPAESVSKSSVPSKSQTSANKVGAMHVQKSQISRRRNIGALLYISFVIDK